MSLSDKERRAELEAIRAKVAQEMGTGESAVVVLTVDRDGHFSDALSGLPVVRPPATSLLRGGRILIVDDGRPSLELFSRILDATDRPTLLSLFARSNGERNELEVAIVDGFSALADRLRTGPDPIKLNKLVNKHKNRKGRVPDGLNDHLKKNNRALRTPRSRNR